MPLPSLLQFRSWLLRGRHRATPLLAYCCLFGLLLTGNMPTKAAPPLANMAAEQTDASSVPRFGASALLGPAREPCANSSTDPDATILAPTDNWEAILESSSGGVFLLRGGVYMVGNQLRLPAGSPTTPLIIKPFNCESVTIEGTVRPRSHTMLAGLTIRLPINSSENWVIRFDGKNLGHLTQMTLRNSIVEGGKIDAIRVSDDVDDLLITGNYLDGGSNGHVLMITSENQEQLPTRIVIDNNQISKSYFSSPAEDMFQVRDAGEVIFSNNSCVNGLNMEQCVDIKETALPVIVRNNLFDGDTLHLIGAGEDGADGCLVIHERDGHAENHQIIDNLFKNCKGTSIRLGTGGSSDHSRATILRNIFFHPTNNQNEYVIPIWKSNDVIFHHNTIIRGHLKLGNGSGSLLPIDADVSHNIFYQTRIDDHLDGVHTYTCRLNLLFETIGNGFAQPCPDNLSANPLFVNLALLDVQLQANSPAIGVGDDGVNLGAYPFANFLPQLFIPIAVASP